MNLKVHQRVSRRHKDGSYHTSVLPCPEGTESITPEDINSQDTSDPSVKY